MILLIGVIGSSYSQSTFKESIKDYDDVCFCEVGLAHPATILDMDNNMEILFALKKGKTLYELDKLGVKHNESQIGLLLASGLIEKKDSIYTSTVPIISKNESVKLREQTKKFAGDMIPMFQKDYDILFQILNLKGLKDNSYSIFFAFVLDGLVWDILDESGAIKSTNITKEKPFWDGVMWMIEPKRTFSCGTNSLSSGKLTMSVNWSDQSGVKVSSYKMLRKLLNDYKSNGKITDPDVIKTFENNGIFNKNGDLQIPIIKADTSDIIYRQSQKIAKTLVAYLMNNIDYSILLDNYPNMEKGQGVIILYHEIMWDILDIMEEKGKLEKPVAFKEPAMARPEDLKDLIFIIEE
jgi:hypothetical protein